MKTKNPHANTDNKNVNNGKILHSMDQFVFYYNSMYLA